MQETWTKLLDQVLTMQSPFDVIDNNPFIRELSGAF